MPKAKDHLDQAKSNDEFSKRLTSSSDGPYDWAVTVVFYAALHYLESWLIKERNTNVLQEAQTQGKSPHAIRGQKARDYLPEDQAIQYAYLRQQSEFARYFTSKGSSITDVPYKYFSQGTAEKARAELNNFKVFLNLQTE